MNTEIERKFALSDYKEAKEKIVSLGAELISITNDVDQYFKVPEEKPRTKYLRTRIRKEKNEITLAYHEVINDLETSEWETKVEDLTVTNDLLQKLGFERDVLVDKTREKYILGSSEILIDHINDLGYFIEIESPTEEELNSIATKLNLRKPVSGAGYPDLLKESYEKSAK